MFKATRAGPPEAAPGPGASRIGTHAGPTARGNPRGTRTWPFGVDGVSLIGHARVTRGSDPTYEAGVERRTAAVGADHG